MLKRVNGCCEPNTVCVFTIFAKTRDSKLKRYSLACVSRVLHTTILNGVKFYLCPALFSVSFSSPGSWYSQDLQIRSGYDDNLMLRSKKRRPERRLETPSRFCSLSPSNSPSSDKILPRIPALRRRPLFCENRVDNVRRRTDYVVFVGVIKRHKEVTAPFFSQLITSVLENMKVVLRDKVTGHAV